ncbi:hypothetical protein ACVXHA_06220 [Escherichia coli]
MKGGDYKPEEIAGSKKSGPTAAKCWCSTSKTVARPLTSSRGIQRIKKANRKAVHNLAS